MRTAAILPVKRFAHAKQRLGASVADPLRMALAGAMVGDVLLALSQTPAIERTIVVTDEHAIEGLALEHGALLVRDEPQDGQSAAAAFGIARALQEGFERVLCVPGDCPALDPAELQALLADAGSERSAEARGTTEVVIIPDRHGTGTNGLLLCPPAAIEPSFGPGSCERHAGLARSAGVGWRLERPSSLLLDIDTGEDLAALRERLAGTSGRAERTRAVLADADSLTIPSPA